MIKIRQETKVCLSKLNEDCFRVNITLPWNSALASDGGRSRSLHDKLVCWDGDTLQVGGTSILLLERWVSERTTASDDLCGCCWILVLRFWRITGVVLQLMVFNL